MSWFDEQLRFRKESDDRSLENSIDKIAQAVMGQRLTEALSNSQRAKSAIDAVLKYYHRPCVDVPEKILEGPLEEQLEYRLRPAGILYRSVTLDSGWYHNAAGPMIGTLSEDGSAIVLLPGAFSGYYFYDPKTGSRTFLNRTTEKLLDAEAICFYKALPQKSLAILDLLRFTVEQCTVWDRIVYICVMAAASVLGLVSPLITQWLFGDVLNSGSPRVLLALAGFAFCFSVSQVCYSVFQSLISSRMEVKQEIGVQAAVMNRIMSLPVTFFRQYSSGELQQRASYVQSLCSLLLNTIGSLGLTSVFSLVYLGQIFAFAPALVIPSLCVTLATLAGTLVTTFAQMKISRERMETSAKTSGLTHSIITGIQKIKLAGAEKRLFVRWANQYSKEAALEYNPPVFLKLNSTITLTISLAGSMLLSYLAVASHVSVANYYAFNAAYGMVSGAFLSVAGIATTLANIKPTLEMARPIMEAVPESPEGKEIVTDIRGNIELANVSFRYDESMPWVLDSLSLRVKAGEYLAIVGPTGCGKSTFLRILLGFEVPQKGYVYYDRKDISKVDLKSLRRKIGVVMQDGKLFWGDIFSNIVVAAPQLTLEDAWEAAEIASVADDIRAMPMGMHTIISEGQGGISGGQRQRLLIARAVAAKPKVLMFDEATSALDNITQRKVSEAIDKLKCTRIVIAHRLSTIRHCDRIIVLDAGRIVEEGTYEELIAQGGFFADLVARQRLET